jgi:hypothetical protein
VIDVVLLAGRLLLLALLYLFLFAAVRTGIGLVSGQRLKSAGVWRLRVARGPKELTGVSVPLSGPLVIGRSPGSDIVIGDDFVSALHAKIYQKGNEVVVEDLGSTNGTILNGDRLRTPSTLRPGDTIDIGTVRLEVDRG